MDGHHHGCFISDDGGAIRGEGLVAESSPVFGESLSALNLALYLINSTHCLEPFQWLAVWFGFINWASILTRFHFPLSLSLNDISSQWPIYIFIFWLFSLAGKLVWVLKVANCSFPLEGQFLSLFSVLITLPVSASHLSFLPIIHNSHSFALSPPFAGAFVAGRRGRRRCRVRGSICCWSPWSRFFFPSSSFFLSAVLFHFTLILSPSILSLRNAWLLFFCAQC